MPPTHQGPPTYDHHAGNAVAFLTSLVLHVSLLLTLACWAYSTGKASHGLLLQADVGDSQSVALDMLPSFEVSPPANSSTPPAETHHPAPEQSLNVTIDPLLLPPMELAAEKLTADLAAALIGSSDSSALANEQNQASTALGGYGRGANFFGTYAHGDRFVYVLDSSSSMTGVRWQTACDQLINSLNALESGQEFFVICFDYQTTFLFNLPPHRLKFSVKTNKSARGVRNWLSSRTLGRATMPAEALKYALGLNPDAIFLLSDGELQDDSLLMLRLLNSPEGPSRQIPIHTISLFSQEGWFTLRQIAADNGGNFSPVATQ